LCSNFLYADALVVSKRGIFCVGTERSNAYYKQQETNITLHSFRGLITSIIIAFQDARKIKNIVYRILKYVNIYVYTSFEVLIVVTVQSVTLWVAEGGGGE
jgi:hypothetical protein